MYTMTGMRSRITFVMNDDNTVMQAHSVACKGLAGCLLEGNCGKLTTEFVSVYIDDETREQHYT